MAKGATSKMSIIDEDGERRVPGVLWVGPIIVLVVLVIEFFGLAFLGWSS